MFKNKLRFSSDQGEQGKLSNPKSTSFEFEIFLQKTLSYLKKRSRMQKMLHACIADCDSVRVDEVDELSQSFVGNALKIK